MSVLIAKEDLAVSIRWFPFSPFDVLRIVLGIILLCAGLLKGYELATGSVVGTSLLTSPVFLLLVVEWELLLGLWLLAGFWPQLLRWTALVWFTLLLGVALSQAASGARSCSCFGFIEVAPWAMVAVDLAAVMALSFTKPSRIARPCIPVCTPRLILLGFIILYLLLAIPSAVAVWRNGHSGPPLVAFVSTLDLGTIPQGGYREASFSLSNPGTEPVEITALETSCPCLDIDLAKKRILPGETIIALARFDGQRESHFVGKLRIEARGRSQDGWLLLMVIEANVQKWNP